MYTYTCIYVYMNMLCDCSYLYKVLDAHDVRCCGIACMYMHMFVCVRERACVYIYVYICMDKYVV